jgi:hypothetical protein
VVALDALVAAIARSIACSFVLGGKAVANKAFRYRASSGFLIRLTGCKNRRANIFLKDIQEGRIDLALELVRLRRDCAGELDEAACHEQNQADDTEFAGQRQGQAARTF